jgi:hypothetical protein
VNPPFTIEELAEIEARWRASSASSRAYGKSPWKVSTELDGFLVAALGSDGEDGKNYYVVTDGVHASELQGGAKADAELIANAPKDIKRLALAYAQLLSENVELKVRLERLRDDHEDFWTRDD